MTRFLNDPGWTESQREFVENLQATGATSVAKAVSIDRSMSLPERELQSLVDSGIVREAAAGRYYLYPGQARSVGDAVLYDYAPREPLTPSARMRMLKTMIFWFIVIIIPIVLLRLFSAGD